jgi:hypothetical protein
VCVLYAVAAGLGLSDLGLKRVGGARTRRASRERTRTVTTKHVHTHPNDTCKRENTIMRRKKNARDGESCFEELKRCHIGKQREDKEHSGTDVSVCVHVCERQRNAKTGHMIEQGELFDPHSEHNCRDVPMCA